MEMLVIIQTWFIIRNRDQDAKQLLFWSLQEKPFFLFVQGTSKTFVSKPVILLCNFSCNLEHFSHKKTAKIKTANKKTVDITLIILRILIAYIVFKQDAYRPNLEQFNQLDINQTGFSQQQEQRYWIIKYRKCELNFGLLLVVFKKVPKLI